MDLVLPCSTVALADALVLPTDGANCSCTIFLAQTLLIRLWPKAQPTINICRGWVKELSLSELIRSDAWTILLQKQKHKDGYLTEDSISSVPNTVFLSLFFEGLHYII